MSGHVIAAGTEVSALLREAAEWRLLGLLFEWPAEGWSEQVADLASQIGDETLVAAAAASRQQVSPSLYHTTFGPGGPASPREVSYREGLVPGQFLAELRAYYAAFAYRPTTLEPPDHVAVEAGFISYLHLKTAYAQVRQDAEQTRVASEAAQRFLSEHLSHVAEPLASSLASSGINYLALASEALRARVPRRRNDPMRAPLSLEQTEAEV